jgi:copper transport protein
LTTSAFRRSLVGLIPVIWLALLVPVAAAHATFEGGRPAPGARLSASPSAVVVTFSEPLNRPLSSLTLVRADGSKIPARTSSANDKQLAVAPLSRLVRGVYSVEWHSVSADDGHTLDGSYDFGVQAAVSGGQRVSQVSPLAGGGWLRVALRTGFYAALLFFAGGVLNATVRRRRGPAGWLAVTPVDDPGADDDGSSGVARKAWRRTCVAGGLAAGAAVALVVTEAGDAAGGLSGHALTTFLFSGTVSGWAHVGIVAAVLAAAALAVARRLVGASVAIAIGFAALGLSGHANSAHLRAVALLVDPLHLLAAAVWIGGIAQIVVAWLPSVRGLTSSQRRAVMNQVLKPFGSVAVWAFALLVVAGAANALIELRGVRGLFHGTYGLLIALKIALVVLVAGVSFAHAIRLRPRLLAVNQASDARLERRHWRLLGSEPFVGLAVVVAAATLVAFAPPRQQTARPAAPAPFTAQLTTAPQLAPRQLSVAEEAGSIIVAAWLDRGPQGLQGRLRLLGDDERPVAAPVRVAAASALRPCGVGCLTFTAPGSPAALSVEVQDRGRWYTARLRARWLPDQGPRAQQILAGVQRQMPRLTAATIDESLRGGPAPALITRYRLAAPGRFAYTISRGHRRVAEAIIIGSREWARSAGQSRWQLSSYGGGGAGFRAADYLRWWVPQATNPRLLSSSGSTAEVATLGALPGTALVWFRLRIDLRSSRLLAVRMITSGHFMSQRYSGFDRRPRILPPSPADVSAAPGG